MIFINPESGWDFSLTLPPDSESAFITDRDSLHEVDYGPVIESQLA